MRMKREHGEKKRRRGQNNWLFDVGIMDTFVPTNLTDAL
jgi:hypothetical protein